MRNKISAVILLAGAAIGLGGMAASAQDFKTIESRGAYNVYSASTSAISTHTVSGYGLSWSVKTAGGTANFQIKHSTSNGDPNVNLSSSIYVASGEEVSSDVRGMARNLTIHLTRLDTAATVYIDIEYLAPRAPGAF